MTQQLFYVIVSGVFLVVSLAYTRWAAVNATGVTDMKAVPGIFASVFGFIFFGLSLFNYGTFLPVK